MSLYWNDAVPLRYVVMSSPDFAYALSDRANLGQETALTIESLPSTKMMDIISSIYATGPIVVRFWERESRFLAEFVCRILARVDTDMAIITARDMSRSREKCNPILSCNSRQPLMLN